MEKAYADALTRLGESEKAPALAENLLAHLKGRGRMKLLPKILRELRIREMRKVALAPTLEVAHEKDTAHAEKALKAEGIETPHAKVNHALIQGWRLKSASTLIDRSGKRALIDLYRKVID